MQLTKRDVDILKYVDKFGFVKAASIFSRFGIGAKPGHRRLKTLTNNGYLLQRKILYNAPGVYMLADEPVKVNVSTFDHDIVLPDIANALTARYGGEWISEREIRRDNGFVPHGYRAPDGVLILRDGTEIAVEYEAAMKGSQRLEKILKEYASETRFKEVWYIADGESIAKKIKSAGKNLDYVRVFLVQEVLGVDR